MRWALAVLLWALPLCAEKTHELCAPCHAQQVADSQTHPHFQKGISCDACHGASVKHRSSTGASAPDKVASSDEVPALCGACHAAEKKEYAASKHGVLVLARAKVKAANCTSCHGVHSLRAAQQTEAQCQRCHAALPAACKAAPASKAAAVSCMNCHARHTLRAKSG
ncbi:MAG: hypothetical protein HYX25_02745 [Candidatus Solibacter usitatus]|nr:hypothetical protein [Candidatus Solibacter usitatus]